MSVVLVNVAENGRMVLPAEVRRALGVTGPSQLRVEVTDEGVQLTTPRQALMRARERVRSIVPADRSLSEELIADRCEEVEQEEADGTVVESDDGSPVGGDDTSGGTITPEARGNASGKSAGSTARKKTSR